MGLAGGPQFSPDGRWFWDGTNWQPAISSDGRWRWNGYTWVSTGYRLGGLSAGWLALIAGGVIVALLAVTVPIALIFASSNNRLTPVASGPSPEQSSTSGSPSPSTSIPCDQLEHTQVHYHAYLQVLVQGNPLGIPTNLGRKLDCFYWLHMHTSEAGIIHVESPADRTFTLGDFFDVWSDWSGQAQPLDSTHVSTLALGPSQKLAVYVDIGDGAGAESFTGDPRSIVLKDHEVITLEIAPPAVMPRPAFTWPQGF